MYVEQSEPIVVDNCCCAPETEYEQTFQRRLFPFRMVSFMRLTCRFCSVYEPANNVRPLYDGPFDMKWISTSKLTMSTGNSEGCLGWVSFWLKSDDFLYFYEWKLWANFNGTDCKREIFLVSTEYCADRICSMWAPASSSKWNKVPSKISISAAFISGLRSPIRPFRMHFRGWTRTISLRYENYWFLDTGAYDMSYLVLSLHCPEVGHGSVSDLYSTKLFMRQIKLP